MRKVVGSAVACAVLALPGSAAAAGAGPGLGDPFFTLEKLVSGATSNPDVLVDAGGAATVAFNNYAVPSGTIHVCSVPFAATSCARTTNVVPGPDGAGVPVLARTAAGALLLSNGTANYTELFTSTDDGATFGPGVRISSYTNAEAVLPLPDGNLLLVGRGNDADANAMHVVVVPPDGSGVGTPGWRFRGGLPGASRGVAYNGGRYVVSSASFVSSATTDVQADYAVYSGSGNPNDIASWTTGSLPAFDSTDAPNLADGPAGVVMVGLDDDGHVIASKLSGSAFGAPVRVGDRAGKAYLPNVSQDSTGRITAVWQVNDVGLRSSTSFDGIHWSAPRTLNPDREFDTDVATAPNGTGLAVTRGAGAYLATRVYAGVTLTLAPDKQTIVRGAVAELQAKLVDEHGDPISGAEVALHKGKTTLATSKTGGDGTVVFEVQPKRTTRYRASYAGTEVRASYVTGKSKVKVKRPKKPKK
ncbi:MAG TPA: hypothetical protein VFR97_10985 [Capillimicrobium sp.]|nr:hypothetical protein [Capillimicrobium sp.]